MIPLLSGGLYERKNNLESQNEKLRNNLQDVFEENVKLTGSARITENDINRIIFGKNEFGAESVIDGKSELQDLFEFISRVRELKTTDFSGKFEIEKEGLERLIHSVEEEIENYVFSEGYDTDFINDNPRRGDGDVKNKEYLKLEYNLIKNVWFSVSIYAKKAYDGEYDGKLTLNLMMDLIEDHLPLGFYAKYVNNIRTQCALSSYLTKGESDISSDRLNAFILGLKEFVGRDEQHKRLYENTIKQVKAYAEARQIKIKGDIYPKDFYNDNVMAYHLVKMIVRNLGFDILHFSPLDGKIFVATKTEIKSGQATFIRHHFRNLESWIRRLSMQEGDMILTDSYSHHDYEAFMSELGEAQLLDLLNKFQQLIDMDGDITIQRIKNLFGENHWIFKKIVNGKVQGYWDLNNPKFINNLQIFNMRKDDLNTLNKIYSKESLIIEAFIKEYYSEKVGTSQSSLYYRFFESKRTLTFEKIMNSGLERINAHHNNQKIINYLGSLP